MAQHELAAALLVDGATQHRLSELLDAVLARRANIDEVMQSRDGRLLRRCEVTHAVEVLADAGRRGAAVERLDAAVARSAGARQARIRAHADRLVTSLADPAASILIRPAWLEAMAERIPETAGERPARRIREKLDALIAGRC
jgi:hypothetical protein